MTKAGGQPNKSGRFERTLFVLGLLFGIASLLNYYEVFANQGIYPFLEALVASYRALLHGLFGFLDRPLEALANLIAGLFQWSLNLQPYWKDVFVPIGLYFASSARATHGTGRSALRNALYALGTIVALISSIVLASFGTELQLVPALFVLTTAVVLYEVISYALLLLLGGKSEGTPGFWRYLLERPLPSIALGYFTAVVSSWSFADSENAAALGLIVFILLLGLWRMILAIIFAVENRGGWLGDFRQRLFRSRSWLLGSAVVVSIVAATLGVVWGG